MKRHIPIPLIFGSLSPSATEFVSSVSRTSESSPAALHPPASLTDVRARASPLLSHDSRLCLRLSILRLCPGLRVVFLPSLAVWTF
ncbi:hypothetical protein RJT34_03688 [Clitoria ternatea]|uniref:Uncharacterized protein n=1 Tax=Clitoria ternatea TaxID=43366 RepID=A0AAN9Q2R5_CLITE